MVQVQCCELLSELTGHTVVCEAAISISESSQLRRQCCSIMVQCNSWIAFYEAFSLLTLMDSCSTEWNNVGRRVVTRPRPPLPACVRTRLSLSRIMCGVFFCISPFGCGRVCVPSFPPYTDPRAVPADTCSSPKG